MIGKTLGHYQITSQLGSGGMGEVYLAEDLSLDRKVALKLLPNVFTGDFERIARFKHEAKVLASLNHPNIAAIHGLEQAEGKRFLVLELVEGETLAQRLSNSLYGPRDCQQGRTGLFQGRPHCPRSRPVFQGPSGPHHRNPRVGREADIKTSEHVQ